MSKHIGDDLYQALQEMDHALMDVMNSCLWDGSKPGCDCGCGGDFADYDAARQDESDFLDKLPALLERVLGAYARQEATAANQDPRQ